MKVAILHDYFNKEGGGERLVLGLAKAFKADIYTGFVDYKKTFSYIEEFNVQEISSDGGIPGLRNIKLMRDFAKLRIPNYDLYIFSGTACISAAPSHKPNLLYLHTPPRYLYDLKNWYWKTSSVFQKLGLTFLTHYMYPKDQKYMRKFDKIMSNSDHVKNRVLQYYNKELFDKTETVYSFFDTESFTWIDQSDYYLSYGRLDPLKRVDVIVKAFQQMPDKKLIVLADGPERDKIAALCEGYDNIRFVGRVNQEQLREYIGRCIASIYIPVREDMGLTPIEAAAAGKPTIGSNEGGLPEMILDNKTGLLIKPTISGVRNAVENLDKKKAKSMRSSCEKWGNSFNEKNFLKRVKPIVNEVLAK